MFAGGPFLQVGLQTEQVVIAERVNILKVVGGLGETGWLGDESIEERDG